jgi:sugar fermentation stimulation protein A
MTPPPITPEISIPGLESAGRASFLRRLNRFLVECRHDGKSIRAYLPNPGRLRELLLPGRTLYLSAPKAQRGQKTRRTVLAVERDGSPVLLHTHLANRVAEELLRRGMVPGLENARVIRKEVTIGRNRFDFLLEAGGKPFVLEVKSCTLYGKEMAMFPDAVTERGRRHLEELAGLSRSGTRAGVLFIVHSPRTRYFLPDYHTDPDFARTLYERRRDLLVRALAVECRKDLSFSPLVRDLEIPWDLFARENADRGSYILILRLRRSARIAVGSLGEISFPAGFYLYAGSAKKPLAARMARHLRKRKSFFWHIDYLADRCDRPLCLAVRTADDLEHEIAANLQKIADWSIPAFGASDCNCETHLFGMKSHPLEQEEFINHLQQFRMDRLGGELSP